MGRQGREVLQARAKNKAPKYGDGDPEADRMARDLTHWQYSIDNGANFQPFSTVTPLAENSVPMADSGSFGEVIVLGSEDLAVLQTLGRRPGPNPTRAG